MATILTLGMFLIIVIVAFGVVAATAVGIWEARPGFDVPEPDEPSIEQNNIRYTADRLPWPPPSALQHRVVAPVRRQIRRGTR